MDEKTYEMEEVESSSIKAIGYDEETKTLEIHFVSGSEYLFFGVSKKAHSRLMGAKSVGSHFSKKIRDNYDYEKIA